MKPEGGGAEVLRLDGAATEPHAEPPGRWHRLVPVLVTLALYLPCLWAEFVWDDRDLLLRDAWFASWPALWSAVNEPLVFSDNYFRPVGLLWLGIQAKLFGLEPMAFHAVSMLLHAANTALVVALGMRLRPAPAAGTRPWQDGGIVVGLAYAAHPALVESTSFISAQFDALVTFFVLVALFFDHRVRGAGARAGLIGLAFFLALGSKEMGAALLLVLPCVHLAESPAAESLKKRLAPEAFSYVGMGLGLLAYLLWRLAALGHLVSLQGQTKSAAVTVSGALLASADALFRGVRLAFWPFSSLSPLQIPSVGASSVLVNLLVAIAVVYVIGRLIKRQVPAGWWALGALLSLAPSCFPWLARLAGGAVFADRFAALPIALMCLSLARGWPPVTLKPMLTVAGMWFGGAALTTLLGCMHWRSDATLFSWATGITPTSAVAWVNLSNAQMRSGDLNGVEVSASRAIVLDPSQAMAFNNRGMARLRSGRLSEAESDFRAALKADEKAARAASNLAVALLGQKRFAEAEEVLVGRALRTDPNDPYANLILGELLLRGGKLQRAIRHIEAGRGALPASDVQGRKDASKLLAAARRRLDAQR